MNYVTFSMPTIDTGEFVREKYVLSDILGIHKKVPVSFFKSKKLLARIKLYDAHKLFNFNFKRHYLNNLETGELTVNVCAKDLSERQIACVLDAGEDIVLVKTLENYKNF